ncbi:MAG: hypothetical protein KBH14_06155 [Vicinamibacteria bacterium]|jgi:hypothetical protein|nr:hypothetical protein [Vicinamibacteria bacterium]MBP9945957.1 hypothetical protein [Vicinamibacteria bacterium]
MFQRFSNSWALVKASAEVLRADKELMVFPVISAALSVLVLITFAVPSVLAGLFDAAGGESGLPLAGYVVGFLFYVVQYFVIFFCNTALVGAALIRLRGGDPTVADGFRIASSRLGPIMGYALIAATVGMILRSISERSGVLGKIVVSLVGLAWNLATFLVVPVLAAEDVGPIDAVKRSGAYLRKTWGEQIVGNAGMGAVFGVMTFGSILLGLILFIAAAFTESTALMAMVGVGLVVTLVGIALISATLGGIYAAALYRYASEGDAGTFFSPDMVKGAFQQK